MRENARIKVKKNVFVGFMDLEKAYDSVDRKGLFQVLSIYGISGRLLGGTKSLIEGSKACVKVNGDRKSTRLNSSHRSLSRMPSSA